MMVRSEMEMINASGLQQMMMFLFEEIVDVFGDYMMLLQRDYRLIDVQSNKFHKFGKP